MKLVRCKDCGHELPAPGKLGCEHTFEEIEVFTAGEVRERLGAEETLTKVANTLRPYGAAVESVCEDAGWVLDTITDVLFEEADE